MPRLEEKKKVVAEIEERLKSAKAAIFADYRGLNVAEATQLRRKFKEAGAEFRVVKNTLTRIAASRSGIEGIDEFLIGPTAIAFGFDDPVVPAKLLVEFIKENQKLEIKGGLIEGKVVKAAEVKSLADLPSRDVLISRVLGGLQAPIAGLQFVLKGPLQKLVYVLRAIEEQKAAG
ncbi:MAG: 50S ribosomal protein L10 [Thermoanaerobacterales bacterium 50_218]|nr:MAG: 50S ribosomal protein L10 [Thermoanaerobacterales bacterium 50_218]HAA90671.1 50S ribosomal protein L10 [Peptococcaceae bacterium]